MSIDIVMPALSPGMEKGRLARWLKGEGDAVKIGDIIAEIETDKATLEVEAAADGVLTRIIAPAGSSDVLVNERIAILQPNDVAQAEDMEPEKAASAPVASVVAEISPAGARDVALQPGARNGAASPRARRLARELGVDLSLMFGSGPQRRILERDIRGAVAAAMARPDGSAASIPNPAAHEIPLHSSGDRLPHDEMRLTIARRLTQAKRDIPHFYLARDWEVDAFLDLRQRVNVALSHNAHDKPVDSITINDMLIKAWALALQETPDANVAWTEEGMIRHAQVDIAVAVSTPGGLVTPVVRAAESKSIGEIAREMRGLATRARERRLRPEEYQGGSSSISNLGMFGVDRFAAIVNPPQATILAVGAAEKRMIVKDDAPRIARMMSFTLSLDDRAVDGALGATLMARFGALLAAPMRLFA